MRFCYDEEMSNTGKASIIPAIEYHEMTMFLSTRQPESTKEHQTDSTEEDGPVFDLPPASHSFRRFRHKR
jgi:hypothetical protein